MISNWSSFGETSLFQSFIQDKEDDLKVGIKSTALRFGDSTKQWIMGFGIACISSLALSGFNAEIGNAFFFSQVYFFSFILKSVSFVKNSTWLFP